MRRVRWQRRSVGRRMNKVPRRDLQPTEAQPCADCHTFEATVAIYAGFGIAFRVCEVCAEEYPERCRRETP